MLQGMKIRSALILLDEPVSNSGRLRKLIYELGENCPFSLDVRIPREVDRELYGKQNVITSDSVILDHCASWTNLTAACLKKLDKHGLNVWK